MAFSPGWRFSMLTPARRAGRRVQQSRAIRAPDREVSCPVMSTLSQDLRYAIRALRTNPGFTIAAVLSLAIGIGANTAIFSVASALLLHPLPYADADRLAILWNRSPGLGITEDWFSTAQYFDIKNGTQSFEQRRDRDRRQLQPDRRRRARARRHDPRVVEPAADARRARRCSAGCSAPTTIGRAAPARRVLGLRHVDAPLRRRSARRRPVARRSTVSRIESSACCRRRSRCRARCMPTLGGAEDAEIVMPLPLAADAAEIRNREDYNILGEAEAGRRRSRRRRPRWTRSRRGCGAIIPISIRRTAG